MVNTRRMESSSSATHNGPRYQTKKTESSAVLGSSCDSDSGGAGGEEESHDDEDSWSCEGKTKNLRHTKSSPRPPLPARVRELRSRFVCNERKFSKSLHHHKRELRSDLTHSRHFFSGKMHDLDSEEDCYSPRRHSKRNQRNHRHHSNPIIISRVERRTALSLRPIKIKSYAQSGTCNSDDSEFSKVRRSTRARTSGDKNVSWLTDNHMHKVGYPNLEQNNFLADDGGDEDSRDTQDLRDTEPTKRSAGPNSKYLYSYTTVELDSTAISESNHRKLRSSDDCKRTSSGESHDKENKEDNLIDGRLKKAREKIIDKGSNSCSILKDVEEKIKDEDDTEVENVMEVEENNQEDNDEDNAEEETKEVPESDQSDSEDEANVRRSRRNGQRASLTDRYSPNLPPRNNRDGSSSSDPGIKAGYRLRDRPPKPVLRGMPNPRPVRTRSERKARNYRQEPSYREKIIHSRRRFNRRKVIVDDSNTSSSDSDEVQPRKYTNSHPKNETLKSGAGGNKLIPIGPDTLDPKVTFNSVGGLHSHVQCLKEMILLPMMYPEVFQRFQIEPPRGVLFHGPPGTGKTLIARALANECSFGSRKVSFFMRKGADLLSKWIGESEKQLRLLFEQADEMKPSIIFFDELDGLAPVRSSRQDQIHASIVSTLLALMDGLTARGEVIVIGATNRIDAIDPALRRPGRFDRELFFPLPARTEREEILKVHVAQWATPPSDQLVTYLADSAAGYCGSDLRALCSEAVIQSFRRTYPQVYTADHRLCLNPEKVKVEKLDFLRAKSMLVPASQRISQGICRKLLPVLEPLLRKTLNGTLAVLEKSFPHGIDPNLAKVRVSAGVRPAQLLLTGDGPEHGQTAHLAPAILHKMEHIHSHTLDLATLHRESGRSPEEACIQVFQEARRNVPSIIYIPNIDHFWSLVSETVRAIFIAQLVQLDPNSPILILATADSLIEDLPEAILSVFSRYRKEIFKVNVPHADTRREFFRPLIIDSCLKTPRLPRCKAATPPPLEKAPTPPPIPISEEAKAKMAEQEERTLRELRIFLRDMCKKLASNRLFFMFTKPVDMEEVPDYLQIIKQPMDLETMMTKVDFHSYECAKDFLQDVELIVENALEYNPARTSTDKQIRHRACSLRDYAFALIKNEMDSDFDDRCEEIAKKRKLRNVVKRDLPSYLQIPEITPTQKGHLSMKSIESSKTNGSALVRASPSRKRKNNTWSRGSYRKKRRKIPLKESQLDDQQDEEKLSSGEESKENNPIALDETELTPRKESCTEDDIDDKPDIMEEDTPKKSPPKRRSKEAPRYPAQKTLTVNCDTTSDYLQNDKSPLQSPNKRRLSDLLSPSELLDDSLDFDDVDQALNETSVPESTGDQSRVNISHEELEKTLQLAVNVTANHSLQSLLDLNHQLSRIVKKYSKTHNRNYLPKELQKELSRFEKENSDIIVSSIQA